MNEQEEQIKPETKEEKKEGASEILQEESPIEEARKLRDELKELNNSMKANLEEQKKIMAQNILSGRASAGHTELTEKQKQEQIVDKEVADTINRFYG